MHTQKYLYPASLAALFFALVSIGVSAKDDEKGKKPDCGHRCGQPAPSPVPAPPPPSMTTVTLTPAQEQAQRQAQEQAQQAIAGALAKATGGQGGAGGLSQNDIQVVNDNWSRLSADQKIAFKSDPSAKSVLDAVLTTGNNTNDNASQAQANGNGSPVSIADNSRQLTFVPVQVAPLPPTLTAAGSELRKMGECGPQWKVKPYDNAFFVPYVWGSGHSREPLETMHGKLDGREAMAFRTETLNLGEPIWQRIVIAWGHQLYMVATSSGQGGAGGGSLNHSGGSMNGVGTSLSANASHASIGVVAIPCEYAKKVADTAPPPPPLRPRQPLQRRLSFRRHRRWK